MKNKEDKMPILISLIIVFIIIGMYEGTSRKRIVELEQRVNRYEQSYENYVLEDSLRQVK